MKLIHVVFCLSIILTAVIGGDENLNGAITSCMIPLDKLIKRQGYSVESYAVHTPDRAVIVMHRILPKTKVQYADHSPKLPVLLLTGITMSSCSWIMFPKISLAYGLADRGYDVWLCDFRGMNLMNLIRTVPMGMGPKGWHFTQDDLAKYDMPTFIDFVLNNTRKPNLHTIGFSMGNTVVFQLLASKPEYNDKVASLIAMAPSVYLEKLTGPMRLFNKIPFGSQLLFLISAASGFGALILSGGPVRLLTIPASISNIYMKFLRYILLRQFGHDPDFTEKSAYMLLTMETPVPTLVYYHYFQTCLSGKFTYFDYGEPRNLEFYGQKQAPEYNLTNVQAPVTLIYSEGDAFESKTNNQKLVDILGPSLVENYLIDDKSFGHMSFVSANDLHDKVNVPIYRMLESFSNS